MRFEKDLHHSFCVINCRLIIYFLYPVPLFQVCKTWCRLAQDEYLWKELFYRYWQIDHKTFRAAGCSVSFKTEFVRLYYHTPVMESEVLKEHKDQVLHVSFSHCGDLLSTTSKDGYVKVKLYCTKIFIVHFASFIMAQ